MICGTPNMKHHPNETMVKRTKMQGISTSKMQGLFFGVRQSQEPGTGSDSKGIHDGSHSWRSREKKRTSQDQVEDEPRFLKVNGRIIEYYGHIELVS